MKKIVLLVVLCGFASFRAFAQHSVLVGANDEVARGTGFVSGYQKTGSRSLNTKHQVRQTCRGSYSTQTYWNGQFYPGGYIDSIPLFNNWSPTMPTGFIYKTIMLNNRDSSAKICELLSIGIQRLWVSGYYTIGQTASLVNRTCNQCADFTDARKLKTFDFLNEVVSDTSLSFRPNDNYAFRVDSPAATGGITLFHGQYEALADSASYRLRNIVSHYTRASEARTFASLFYSRIFRFFDYPSINSPEATNRAMIVAIKGKPQSYSFGFIDKERDSISVTPLHMQVSYKLFHPTYPFSAGSFILTPAEQAYFKRALKDSTQPLEYKPGYSPANPFGPGSTFTLDSRTGDFTFTAPDTGRYYLAFRITEYRDGRPLGDIMTYRIAWVLPDTTAILPTVAQPKNISGATYDSTAKLMTICPGTAASFTIGATSSAFAAALQLAHNFPLSALNSNTIYSGNNTNAPNLAFTWQPTAADAGYHDVYVTATDITCGYGHALVPASRAFRILVPGPLKAQSADSVLCAGSTATLGIAAGSAGPYTWSVVPGGDGAALSCTVCAAPTVHPSVTTRYAVVSTAGGCTRRDTFTVRVVARPVAGTVTASLVGGTQYAFSAPGAQSASSYSWLFGHNGAAGTGASVTYTYPANGTFNVRLIVKNNCGADTAYKTIVTGNGQNTNGIGSTVNNNEVSIYPNPASQRIKVQVAQGSIKSYRLLGANGLVAVKETELKGQAMEAVVDVSRLAAGIYTLQLQTSEGVITRQVEISR